MPPEEAESRFEEALAVLVRALGSDAPFSHHGRYWHFEDIVVEPPPAQRPHPPLWMAASSADSIRGCARRGVNLLLDQFGAPELIGERIALYRRELEAAGHPYDPARVAVARNFWVATDAADKEVALRRQGQANERLLVLSRGPATQAILASMAIPAAFEPVTIDNRLLCDGAIASNTPVSTAIALGARRLIVLPTGFACAPERPPSGAIAHALHAITLLTAGQLVAELERVKQPTQCHILPTTCPLGVSPFDIVYCAGSIRFQCNSDCGAFASGSTAIALPSSCTVFASL